MLSAEDEVTFARLHQVDFSFGWRGHPALALRIIPDRIPTLEEIGVPPQVRELMHLPQGLVLFKGTTGSGKSTTQAAMTDFEEDPLTGDLHLVENHERVLLVKTAGYWTIEGMSLH